MSGTSQSSTWVSTSVQAGLVDHSIPCTPSPAETSSPRMLGPLPLAVAIFLVLFAIGWVVLDRTATGRVLYVIGDNADVARFCRDAIAPRGTSEQRAS